MTSQIHVLNPQVLRREAKCLHCWSQLPVESTDIYCCHGCQTAHDLIEKFDLSKFYTFLDEKKDEIGPSRASRTDYSLIDSSAYQKDFVERKTEDLSVAHFYMQNLTCYACVWVCEELTRKLDPEARLAINFSSGEASLHFNDKSHDLSYFISSFEALGFAVSPNQEFTKDTRSDIARIGVSAFCLMNIMMLAFPEYLDAKSLEVEFRDLFRWISSLLATVAIIYGGWPLLRGAVYALKNRSLHLDIPLGLAILSSHALSLYNTFRGNLHVFYDTTSAVVLLLLVGRFVQAQALAKLAQKQNRLLEGDLRFVRVLRANDCEETRSLGELVTGDVVRFLPGEVIPIDGELLSVQAELDYGLLTGERHIQAIAMGGTVRAGALCGSEPLVIKALQDGLESELLRLRRASQALHEKKGFYLGLSEKMAKYFVVFVLGSAGLTFLFWLPMGYETAITRFVAVLLVACPCIFAFGAPLVIARAFHFGLQRGIIFKSQKSLERLSEVKNFYFDKTGTLTEDASSVEAAYWYQDSLDKFKLDQDTITNMLSLLPRLTQHHVAKALAHWIGEPLRREPLVVKAVREYFGQGLSFVWDGREVRIGRHGFCLNLETTDLEALQYSYVAIDNIPLLRFKLDERLRDEAKTVLEQLTRMQKQTWMLTGDGIQRALSVGQAVGMQTSKIAAHLSPDDKKNLIINSPDSAMVGNGFNDSLAISKVAIGIALENATDSLKESADLIFKRKGLWPLLDALALATGARGAMQRCFGFAVLFNFVGLTLAVTGLVTPVMAAVLMPISSLTIFTVANRWQPRWEELQCGDSLRSHFS